MTASNHVTFETHEETVKGLSYYNWNTTSGVEPRARAGTIGHPSNRPAIYSVGGRSHYGWLWSWLKVRQEFRPLLLYRNWLNRLRYYAQGLLPADLQWENRPCRHIDVLHFVVERNKFCDGRIGMRRTISIRRQAEGNRQKVFLPTPPPFGDAFVSIWRQGFSYPFPPCRQ